MEMARIREQLKAVEEKYEIAQSDLEETCKSFDVTKTEYENLEKELEILEDRNSEIKRAVYTRKLWKNRQLENQIHLLQEQIHSAKQNETQYQERALALEGDIEKRKERRTELSGRKVTVRGKVSRILKDAVSGSGNI